MRLPVFIKKLRQVDNYRFEIVWSDGSAAIYRLSDLQRLCPCANCVDENTGVRVAGEKAVSDNVKAKKIYNIGRYALKIDFTSGCSTGIYSFDMLYALAKGRSISDEGGN